MPVSAFTGGTGELVLEIARRHLGEEYIPGARVPMTQDRWSGPWDCAEFVSWCVYRASGILFGTEPRTDPILADACTRFWFDQAVVAGSVVDWRDAAAMPGAAVLRLPSSAGGVGHIALSDGQGGTVEAHSRLRGVIAGCLSGRRWDCGILVPGICYRESAAPVALGEDIDTLHLTHPLTRGERVRRVQRRLGELGLLAGAVDGSFGPETARAVQLFQARRGLAPDGEVGVITWAALGLDTAPD